MKLEKDVNGRGSLENKNTSLRQRILEKIKKGEVEMRPAGCFLFYSCACFIFGAIIFLIAVWFFLLGIHFVEYFKVFDLFQNKIFLSLILFPLSIFLFSLFLVFVASRFYRKGRVCCRHEEWMLLGFLAILFLAVGLATLAFGHTKKGQEMTKDYKLIHDINNKVVKYWNVPEKGTLAGMVQSGEIVQDKIVLVSIDGKIWQIDIGCCHQKQHLCKKKMMLKSIGQEMDQANFKAVDFWELK